jgi:hypothetical protein
MPGVRRRLWLHIMHLLVRLSAANVLKLAQTARCLLLGAELAHL